MSSPLFLDSNGGPETIKKSSGLLNIANNCMAKIYTLASAEIFDVCTVPKKSVFRHKNATVYSMAGLYTYVYTLCNLAQRKTLPLHQIASAPTMTGSAFMRRFRLGFGTVCSGVRGQGKTYDLQKWEGGGGGGGDAKLIADLCCC